MVKLSHRGAGQARGLAQETSSSYYESAVDEAVQMVAKHQIDEVDARAGILLIGSAQSSELS
jgi:hypothetical protein